MTRTSPPVVIDAMGGDHAPEETVAGAVVAAREHLVPVLLAGPAARLHALLAERGAAGEVDVAHAPDIVPMEEPGSVARALPRSSVAIACDIMARGNAAALVSAGSTGATVTAALSRLPRAPNLLRPAIAVVLPTRASPTVLLDAGATADPTPEMIAQFALLGVAYARVALGTPEPRVGLLSIGSEPCKGSRLVRRAAELLAGTQVRLVGNVEGSDLHDGAADVVVTDGFTGNVVLKTMEGSLRFALGEIRAVLGTVYPAGSAITPQRLRRVAARFDPETYGGAALLGLAGTVVIAHGSARARAIANACALARDLVHGRVVECVREHLTELRAVRERW